MLFTINEVCVTQNFHAIFIAVFLNLIQWSSTEFDNFLLNETVEKKKMTIYIELFQQ